MNANLAFYDGLDGKIDWPFDHQGNHPLTKLLLADFLVVDASKPFAEASYFEIERSMLERRAHVTPGGRWLNQDIMDFVFTLYINGGNQPSEGNRSMTAFSEISMPAVCPAPGPPALTDGAIAVLNLEAQIDGLEGHGTSAEAATLIDLLILRGLILGRVRDYERAAQLADHLVHDAATDAAGYMARARTRAVFHRFSEALHDLDHADRILPQDTQAKQERAAILQALGRYDEALVTYEDAADHGGQFEQAGALAGLWADRGETDTAQRLYLESLRTYRGVSPLPLALLDFQLGTMWMRHDRLDQARTCFEAAIRQTCPRRSKSVPRALTADSSARL
jgi:hypothetical protein